jgi:hypothetical protein
MTSSSVRSILGLTVVVAATLQFGGDVWSQTTPTDQRDSRGLFEQANAAFDDGQIEDAVRLYKGALILVVPKEHPEILRNLVVALRKLGKGDESRLYADMLITMGAEVPPVPAATPAAPPSEPPRTAPQTENVAPEPIQKQLPVHPADGMASTHKESGGEGWTWENLYQSRVGNWYGWLAKYAAYLIAIVVFVFGAILSSDGEGGAGCLVMLVGVIAAALGIWLL